MDSEFYWRTFQSTGSVQEYLHYKQAKKTEELLPAGEDYANGNPGPGSAGSEGGRE